MTICEIILYFSSPHFLGSEQKIKKKNNSTSLNCISFVDLEAQCAMFISNSFFFDPNKCIKCVLTKACHDLVVNWSFFAKIGLWRVKVQWSFQDKTVHYYYWNLEKSNFDEKLQYFFFTINYFSQTLMFFIICVGFFSSGTMLAHFWLEKTTVQAKEGGFWNRLAT